MPHRTTTLRTAVALLAAVGLAAAPAGCGDDEEPASSAPAKSESTGTKRVLPVAANPIANDSTAPGLAISKALVENNVSPETGKDVSDHLEVALENTTSKPLDGIEIFYKISDRTKGVSEGYYSKLDGFVIPPGATRVAHFDDTGRKDHFPVNKYSLYYVDTNELIVDVMASAPTVKPATFTVRKDAGGAEAGVEQD
jgi:hypothetical protein